MCRCQRHSVPCSTSVEGARMSAEIPMGQTGMGDVDANIGQTAEVMETGSLLEGFLNHGKETFSLKIPK